MSGRDPGLQPERTLLAWRRVVLILLGLAAAVPGLAWPALGATSVAIAAGLAIAALVLLGAARRRYHLASHGSVSSAAWAILTTAALTAGLGLGALAIVVGGGGPIPVR